MDVEVLFVDDEKDILKALTRVMRREGISVASCESAEDALEWLQSYKASFCF